MTFVAQSTYTGGQMRSKFFEDKIPAVIGEMPLAYEDSATW